MKKSGPGRNAAGQQGDAPPIRLFGQTAQSGAVPRLTSDAYLSCLAPSPSMRRRSGYGHENSTRSRCAFVQRPSPAVRVRSLRRPPRCFHIRSCSDLVISSWLRGRCTMRCSYRSLRSSSAVRPATGRPVTASHPGAFMRLRVRWVSGPSHRQACRSHGGIPAMIKKRFRRLCRCNRRRRALSVLGVSSSDAQQHPHHRWRWSLLLWPAAAAVVVSVVAAGSLVGVAALTG